VSGSKVNEVARMEAEDSPARPIRKSHVLGYVTADAEGALLDALRTRHARFTVARCERLDPLHPAHVLRAAIRTGFTLAGEPPLNSRRSP
jgi:hypothetical protein